MFFGHDLKLQTGFTETSEPVLIIFPFSLVLIRLKVFRVVNPVATNFERNFHFRNFRIFHRWTIGGPPVGKPSCNVIFPHRWPPVVHRWPLVGYHRLSVRVATDWIPPKSNMAERSFSTAKNIYTPIRNRLTPLHLEELMLLKLNSGLWDDKLCSSLDC